MNYSPFLNKHLNKSLNFKTNTQYYLSSNKKNGRIFVLSAIASIVVMTTFVILFTDDSISVAAQKSDLPEVNESQITTLDLPEVGYQSQILSKAVIYTEGKTTSQAELSQSDAVVSVPVNPEKNKDLTHQLSVDSTEPDQKSTVQEQPEQTKTAQGFAKRSDKKPSFAKVETTIPTEPGTTKTIVVKKGDTLSAIFRRESLSSSTLYKIVNSGKQAKKLTRIKPGQTFTIALDKDNNIESLKFDFTKVETLSINKQDNKFVSHIESKDIESRQQFASDTIPSSLSHPEKSKGLTHQLLVNTVESVQKSTVQEQPEQTKTAKIVTKRSDKKLSIAKVEATVPTEPGISKTIVVKKGDTLSAIFKRESLSSSTLHKIVHSGKQAKKLTRIKPGQTFTIALDKDNNIKSLKFDLNKVDTLIINKQDKKFVSHIESKDIETRQQFATGTISNSLFSSGQKAGLNSSMIMKLAHIFGWDIDFALDIRKGDSFAIMFEEKYIDDKKIGYGEILSAEFTNNGKVFKAIRYTDASGHTDYYSEKGLSMRKAFLRTPVEFSRISSKFSKSRKHPVLNKTRAHKGVDYAASRGTPIKAVGDGKVIFKGRKGGYGRVIILQHGSKYTTLYAHMNSYNKKLRNGSRVTQGQTIGYVGSSGLASGPHLHYEFRVNNVHRNPLTVKLPSAAPISKKYRADFLVAAETSISQLKLRKQETIALKSE